MSVHPMSRPLPDHPPQWRGAAVSRAEIALYGVYEISKLLAKPGRLETTLSGILDLLSSFLDMRNGLLILTDEAGHPATIIGTGWSEIGAGHGLEPLPQRAIDHIRTTKQPLVIEDVARDPLFAGVDLSRADASSRSRAFIGVPIKEQDKVIGILSIGHDRENPPGFAFDEDVSFLTMVANLVGQTVHLQQLLSQDQKRPIPEQRPLARKWRDTDAGLLPAAPRPGEPSANIVGKSAAIRAVLDKVRIAARSHSTVLLRGETGTGKELFAQTLHDLSPRQDAPFVKLNCAALPESMLESELFGHEKGAFTGALSQRKGRFELADGGTLFLDEIGDISPAFQAKLLRVLQEGEFERVGGSKTIKVDVRLIAATNRNLEEAVCQGQFRADLYYRISVVPISLPPLRDRPADVPLLAREFLRRFNKEHGTRLMLEDAALTVLASCYFPGNVRELENCVRRAATLAPGERIGANDFACRTGNCLSSMLWKVPPHRPMHGSGGRPLPLLPSHPVKGLHQRDGLAPCSDNALCSSEQERLIEAMEIAGWVKAKAGRLLGLSPRQMSYALRKHNIPTKKL